MMNKKLEMTREDKNGIIWVKITKIISEYYKMNIYRKHLLGVLNLLSIILKGL